MKQVDADIFAPVIRNWIEASESLDFALAAPFEFRIRSKVARCIAFLPHFGGPRGMVIGATLPPTYETDILLIECASTAELFYSFVNATMYFAYDEQRIKESLRDWGFFGPDSMRPAWLD